MPKKNSLFVFDEKLSSLGEISGNYPGMARKGIRTVLRPVGQVSGLRHPHIHGGPVGQGYDSLPFDRKREVSLRRKVVERVPGSRDQFDEPVVACTLTVPNAPLCAHWGRVPNVPQD